MRVCVLFYWLSPKILLASICGWSFRKQVAFLPDEQIPPDAFNPSGAFYWLTVAVAGWAASPLELDETEPVGELAPDEDEDFS